MKILIIEDNDIKFNLIQKLLSETRPHHETSRANSYRTGVKEILSGNYNYVILDMTLPIIEHERGSVDSDMQAFGGKLILREVYRKGYRGKFIILSQYTSFLKDGKEYSFDEVKKDIEAGYGNIVAACIHLERSTNQWKDELLELLK